jgi:predicted lipoprotein with Yx(FWY)xxD motif
MTFQGVTGRAREGKHPKPLAMWAIVIAVMALTAAACGSSGAKRAATAAGTVTPAGGGNPSSPIVVKMDNPTYGAILTTAKGFTLYTYTADEPGGAGCTGACLQFWPPLLLTGGQTAPIAGPGVSGLGTVDRGGHLQVAYHGLPLYTYVVDKQPGQVSGQNVVDAGGKWIVATVASTGSTPAGAVTTPPVSQAPVTAAPVTAPPLTAPPATAPATTSPPRTPPTTTAPMGTPSY